MMGTLLTETNPAAAHSTPLRGIALLYTAIHPCVDLTVWAAAKQRLHRQLAGTRSSPEGLRRRPASALGQQVPDMERGGSRDKVVKEVVVSEAGPPAVNKEEAFLFFVFHPSVFFLFVEKQESKQRGLRRCAGVG